MVWDHSPHDMGEYHLCIKYFCESVMLGEIIILYHFHMHGYECI